MGACYQPFHPINHFINSSAMSKEKENQLEAIFQHLSSGAKGYPQNILQGIVWD